MKTAIPSTAKDIQNPTKSSPSRLSIPQSGRLAQLADMMNQSPRVQAQFKLAHEIQDSEHVQKQKSLAAEINHAQTAPAQLRLREEETPAQREEAPLPNRTGLPDQLKSGVESLSGLSLDDVKVHYNSDKPAQLNALAYAQATDIHVAPGQEKHLPHEAWHIVQQKQGRVQPTMQMKGGVAANDDPGLEKEADVMGGRAVSGPQTLDCISPRFMHANTGELIQAKKEIKDEHTYEECGKLSIHFEERIKGSSAGMYGTIAFAPSDDGEQADKIDLVQIASLMTNEQGQQKYDVKEGHRAKVEENIKETDLDTSGDAAVKDMVRGSSAEGFHVDLTFEGAKPRSRADMPEYESAYNAERRGGGWKDPLNIVKMGTGSEVLNEYNISENKVTSRKIDQDPGFNHGEDGLKGTELLDFPVTSKPSTFSFQTAIEADGKIWGTVLWGFDTLFDRGDDSAFVSDAPVPVFQEGSTDKLDEARTNFNLIMANSRAWTSPEALADTKKLLESKAKEKQQEGSTDLVKMADALGWTLKRIDDRARDKETRVRMAGPHAIIAEKVEKLATTHKIADDIFTDLGELRKSIEAKF